MAVPTNVVQTFTQKGLREDLTDMIYDISPTETPFSTNIGTAKSANTLSQWEIDILNAVNLSNAQLQGDDVTIDPGDTPSLRGDYQQILRKSVAVSNTAEAVVFAGRKSEFARLLAKRSKEIKRDLEGIFLANQAAVAPAAATAGLLAGMGAWVYSNTDIGAAGANPPVPTLVPTTARTDGTQRAFSEVILKNVMQKCYTNGASPKMIMLGAANKQLTSTFTGVATKTFQTTAVEATAIIGAVDTYVSDFGILALMPNRFQRTRDAWFVDPEYAAKMFLRPFRMIDLAITGDSMKKVLIGEVTLQVKNEIAFGLAADLS